MNNRVRSATRKPLFPNSWVSAMLASHSALGLAFSAAIYLICLTGSIVVFAQELQRWEQPAAPQVVTVAPATIDLVIAMLREKGPKDASIGNWISGGASDAVWKAPMPPILPR